MSDARADFEAATTEAVASAQWEYLLSHLSERAAAIRASCKSENPPQGQP